jgi:hypothetical protein
MNKYWGPFFYPEDSGAGSVTPFGETGDVAILAEGENDEADAEGDDDKGKDKSDSDDDSEGADGDADSDNKTPEGEDEEAPDEESEEDKSKDKDDEEDEQDVSAGRPSIKAINEKFPGVFKQFPQLKDAYFRADAYSEVFPSVDDAKEAAEKAEILDNFEETLVRKGSAVELLESIKATDPTALNRFIDNLLPSLYNFDTKLFYKATEPVTRQLLWSANQHGKKTGDKNLVASAQHLANYLFGNAEIKEPQGNKTRQEDPERAALERDKQEFEQTRRNEFLTELNNRAGKSLVKVITDGLDPKNTMTEFLRSTITEKVLDEIGNRLEKDERHMNRMRALHLKAQKAGFPKAMTDQITAAYLSAAKLLVPVVRAEIKQKALHGKVEKKNIPNRQIGQAGGNKGTRPNLTKLSPKQVDWSRTSDEDFLNDKVVLRK